jgi:hypothetical protein
MKKRSSLILLFMAEFGLLFFPKFSNLLLDSRPDFGTLKSCFGPQEIRFQMPSLKLFKTAPKPSMH